MRVGNPDVGETEQLDRETCHDEARRTLADGGYVPGEAPAVAKNERPGRGSSEVVIGP